MENKDFFPVKKGMDLSIAKIDPSAIAAAETVKARIQSAYIMAFQKPRDEMEARDRILTACKRTEFAGKAEYSRPQGGKSIKGPSIRFAELALREWGNILSEVQTLYDDESIRRVRVSVLDLETNAQFSKDLQIKKTIERKNKKGREEDVLGERLNSYKETVYILRATDEEMYTKEAAWVSRILRNEGLRLIPTDIIEEGMDQARKTVANRAIQDPEGEKKRLLDAFSGIGIKPKEVEKYIKHSLDTISPPEIVNLRIVYQSIKDGESTWADYSLDREDPKDNNEHNIEIFNKFNNLVLKETGKEVEDTDYLTDFIRTTAQKQKPEMTESQLMSAITEKNFNAFWKRFSQYVEGLKPVKGGSEPQTQKTPESDNPFDQTDWESNRLREQGVIDFYYKNKKAFSEASEKSQADFKAKWERIVSGAPFPTTDKADKPKTTFQENKELFDDPREKHEKKDDDSEMPSETISQELYKKLEDLKTRRPDLYGKAEQVFGEPENDEEYATTIEWINGVMANEK